PLERTWARPTLEINGLWGGFQGEGVKTIIPSEAHAKITCRLVPNQKPERILQLLTAHIKQHQPPGVAVGIQPFGFGARPYLIPADHWGNQAAAAVLREEYGRDPLYIRMGGSVPICEILHEHLGADTVSFGFGQMDEQFHAPNEFFRLKNLERGARASAKLLLRTGGAKSGCKNERRVPCDGCHAFERFARKHADLQWSTLLLVSPDSTAPQTSARCYPSFCRSSCLK